jgi:hypothetical protein
VHLHGTDHNEIEGDTELIDAAQIGQAFIQPTYPRVRVAALSLQAHAICRLGRDYLVA